MIQRYFPCLPVSGFARRTLYLALVAALAACGGGGGGGSGSGNASASSGSGATTVNTGGTSTSTPTNTPAVDVEETDVDAPVDFGSGPVSTSTILSETLRQLAASGDLMTVYKPDTTSSTAFSAGAFGPAFGWPVMPIHMVLLPDGRVLSYGTDDKGVQGAQFHYSVWDPAWNPTQPGADTSPFELLSNVTGTDLFCSTQLVLPGSGQVLLAGGDRIVNGKRNYASGDLNFFNPADNSMRKEATPMAFRRWYATAVTTARGEVVVMGGRDDLYYAGTKTIPGTSVSYSTTPEIYVPGAGWRTLSSAKSDTVFGATNGNNWWYPKSWLAPDGKILTITHDGFFHALDPAGTGTLTPLDGKLPGANWNLPSLMYAPGKILSVRNDNIVSLVDINGAQPVVTRTAAPISTGRKWGFATVLADGTVWFNGGSVNDNALADAVKTSELWNPATGLWTMAANAQKPRMYHNASLLLPSGAVLTGGGGSPGPVRNLNAEVYFPPYLFNPDGSWATRPVVSAAPTAFTWNSSFTLTMGNTTAVDRVVLVRTGSSTHSFNNEQRFKALSFTQSGATLSVAAPTSATEMPPGYYLMFVFQKNPLAPSDLNRLVPSQARIVKLS
jgi:hypothetical protein